MERGKCISRQNLNERIETLHLHLTPNFELTKFKE